MPVRVLNRDLEMSASPQRGYNSHRSSPLRSKSPSAHKNYRYTVEATSFNKVEHERNIDFARTEDSAKKVTNSNLKKSYYRQINLCKKQ
jgi:hypothetical protein